MFSQLGKLLIISGMFLVVAGLVLLLIDKFPHAKIPLGRLPGDIYIKKENYNFYFPIVTCLLISGVLSFLFWLFNHFRK